MKLEYVASGMGHTRIVKKANASRINDPNDPTIKEIQNAVSSLQGRNGHEVSILFNAYRELGIGKMVNAILKDCVADIHSDSGGLQMVTLGHTPTPELRSKVYGVQAELSTIAMSFDEIPIVMSGTKSSKLDTSDRYFDEGLLIQKAVESGQNLKTQIDFFLEKKTDAKPLLIVQGNCFRTYQIWIDTIIAEIGDERVEHLGGIAFGSAALGQGMLEDYKRAFYLVNFDLPESLKKKQIHILGVGSVNRMMPLLGLNREGWIDSERVISYDSTTHTSGLSMGKYYKDFSLGVFPQRRDQRFYYVLDDINNNLKQRGIGAVEEDWLYRRIASPSKWNDFYTAEDHGVEEFRTIFGFFTSSIDNFTKDMHLMQTDDKEFYRFLDKKKQGGIMRSFVKCRDVKDFNEWERSFSRFLPSKPVVNVASKTPTLEDFFS